MQHIKSSILFVLLFISIKSFCQETITVDVLSAVTNSRHYLYVGVMYKNHTPAYTPDFNSIANVMARLQARYDYNHEILRTEYSKLTSLTLVNSSNQAILTEQRKKTTDWADKNYSKIDIGQQANFEAVLTYITAVFKVGSIAEELKLLNNINKVIERLRRDDPDSFYKSSRYEDIKKALVKLKTCDRMKIGEIALEYGLF